MAEIIGPGLALFDHDADGREYCGPLTYRGVADKLWQNDGKGGFRNASGASAPGATVRVVSGGDEQALVVEPTRSYLSQVDTVLTFGIARREGVDRATIRWPDGHEVVIDNPGINRRHRVTRQR